MDQAKLLEWIDERAAAASVPLVCAIYEGLAGRIRRGDFETKEGGNGEDSEHQA